MTLDPCISYPTIEHYNEADIGDQLSGCKVTVRLLKTNKINSALNDSVDIPSVK